LPGWAEENGRTNHKGPLATKGKIVNGRGQTRPIDHLPVSVCESGWQQSPINIIMPHPGIHQNDLTFHYRPTPLTIRNNGHTIQVNYQEGSFLRLNGREYKLRQFHFHDPSEHHIDGRGYPMEMHLVHQNDAGQILVMAVLLRFGQDNPVLSRVGEWMEQHTGRRLPGKGEDVPISLLFNLTDLLPSDPHHFSYQGSLTTPPCSENVHWIILKTPIEISEIQAARFVTTIGPNARPVQEIGQREVQDN
jgi:carbonic anhydrase